MSKPTQTAEDRVPFSRDEIIKETRRAALALASMIAFFGPEEGASKLAAQYLGIELRDYLLDRAYVSDEELDRIPIERLILYRVVNDAYDYAYQTGANSPESREVDLEVNALLHIFPHSDLYGEPSPLNARRPQKLRQMLETFVARYSLDEGYDLSVRNLALLADMSEAAVRTSLSTDRITTVHGKKGQPVVVPHSEAVTWLGRRRGFVSSAKFGRDADIMATMQSIFTATNLDFPGALQKALDAAGLDIDSLAKKASVEQTWLQKVATKGEAADVDLNAIEQVAQALEAPLPVFAGKAVQDLLNRRQELLWRAGSDASGAD